MLFKKRSENETWGRVNTSFPGSQSGIFSLWLEVTVAVVTSSQCYINNIELNLQIKKFQSEYKLDSLKIISAQRILS